MGDEQRVYANHPPLIATETAIAERICGERAWCTRAPAWFLSLSVPFLAYGLARTAGIGSLAGTVLGALIFGLLRSFGILFVPQFETLFIFILMAVVLVVRPQGLLGKHVTSGH